MSLFSIQSNNIILITYLTLFTILFLISVYSIPASQMYHKGKTEADVKQGERH